MNAAGPREERETVIVWSEDDENATIWTASATVYRRMIKRGWFPFDDEGRHAQFLVPVKSVRLPFKGKRKAGNVANLKKPAPARS